MSKLNVELLEPVEVDKTSSSPAYWRGLTYSSVRWSTRPGFWRMRLGVCMFMIFMSWSSCWQKEHNTDMHNTDIYSGARNFQWGKGYSTLRTWRVCSCPCHTHTHTHTCTHARTHARTHTRTHTHTHTHTHTSKQTLYWLHAIFTMFIRNWLPKYFGEVGKNQSGGGRNLLPWRLPAEWSSFQK